MYFISQYGEHDCLFACLTMMLANYHHDRNYLFLPHVDKEYSYREMIDEAQKYQTELVGVKVSDVEELSKCHKFPIIVTLEGKNSSKHSVLLTKINKKYVYYYDPCQGMKKELREIFSGKWTKQALIVDKYEKMSCPIIPPDFIAKKDKITLPILQLLSGLSLLVGTYFIDKSYSMIIPIALFAAFAIFELLFRQSLINAMRNMDEVLYSFKLKNPVNDYYTFYQNIEKYRVKAITNTSSYIFSGLVIVFLTFLLLINARVNAIYVGVSFLLAAVQVIVVKPFFKLKTSEIGADENQIRKANSEYEFNFFAKEAREKSYKLGLYKSVFTYLSVLLFLMTVILVMVFSEVISVTYVVFYLCVMVFLKDEFIKVFEITTSEDFDTLRNKVIQNLKIE